MKLLWVGLFFVASSAHAGLVEALSDSGVKGPPYKKILEQMDQLEKDYPTLVRNLDYGYSVDERPLRMVVIGKQDPKLKNRPTVQITGAIHGNEYMNIVDRLPAAFLKKASEDEASSFRKFYDNGGVTLFVPIVNPDGYDERQRRNANNVDLNRDWDTPSLNLKKFKEPETKALKNALIGLKKQMDLDVKATVDYHCCIGALLYPWSYTRDSIPKADLEAHKDFAGLAQEYLDIKAGLSLDIIGYGSKGISKDYYYDTYGSVSYTYEGKWRQEPKLFKHHISWWEDALAEYSVFGCF